MNLRRQNKCGVVTVPKKDLEDWDKAMSQTMDLTERSKGGNKSWEILMNQRKKGICFDLTPAVDIKKDRDYEGIAKNIMKVERELSEWYRQIEFYDMDFSAAFDAWPQDICLAHRHKEALLNRTLRIHFETNIVLIRRDPYGFIPATRINT